MNWWGSGFITIMIYGSFSESHEQQFTILTENGFDLLTEDGNALLTEH